MPVILIIYLPVHLTESKGKERDGLNYGWMEHVPVVSGFYCVIAQAFWIHFVPDFCVSSFCFNYVSSF